VIVIYIRLFEVNCIDFSFVNCSFVIFAFLVIYFHNYFLRVFCHLGGLFFQHFLIFNLFYTLLLYLRFFGVFPCWYILHIFFLLISITYFVIFVSITQYPAQNEQQ